jgi:hypothetical protein
MLTKRAKLTRRPGGKIGGYDGVGDGEWSKPHTAAAPRHALNPLQRLIQQRLAERGWSYGKVARRGGLPRSTVFVLATTRNLTRPPRPAAIDALARGLDVPVSAVRAAAAESTGLHYYDQASADHQNPGDPDRDLLIASLDELTPEDRRHAAVMVELLRNRHSRSCQAGSADPRDRGGSPQSPIPERGIYLPELPADINPGEDDS